jgi:hypothetical protein
LAALLPTLATLLTTLATLLATLASLLPALTGLLLLLLAALLSTLILLSRHRRILSVFVLDKSTKPAAHRSFRTTNFLVTENNAHN